MSGARDSSRASRSGGATKITVSLIGEGFGVPAGASAAAPRPGGRIEPVTDASGMAPSAVARDSSAVWPPHDLVELLVELLLVQQLAAGGAVDPRAQFGDAILIGVLHLGLTGDQPRQHVVAKREIGGGGRRPHAEHGDRADPDPEHHRPEANLLAGMGDDVAVRRSGGRGAWLAGRRCGGPAMILRMVVLGSSE